MYEQGKTLIELMVTLSIAAVIGAGAAPSLQRFARQQQLSHATNTLHSAAQFAREQAIYLEQTITISNTANPLSESISLNRAKFDILINY